MKQLLNLTLSLFVLFCTLTDLSAQGPTIGNPIYDKETGKTAYRTSDDGIIVYTPTSGGSEIDVINGKGKMTTIDCEKNPDLCKDVLEDGRGGTPPELPEEGKDHPKPTTASGPSSMQVWKEYKSYSKRNKGKMYFRSKSGKWSVIEDWQTMHKNILRSIK